MDNQDTTSPRLSIHDPVTLAETARIFRAAWERHVRQQAAQAKADAGRVADPDRRDAEAH